MPMTATTTTVEATENSGELSTTSRPVTTTAAAFSKLSLTLRGLRAPLNQTQLEALQVTATIPLLAFCF
jgi:hypothetical protein